MTSRISADATIELLECTIRDGNYAVDFKFTESDTAQTVRHLDALGFRWIEVGHGLGLGGKEAGKGDMPGTDLRMIRAARGAAKRARIGAFFIPGIGTKDQLRQAREAGLDFVRIGNNAETVELAFPLLEYARNLGLIPFLNMMKSYAISSAAFAGRVAEADVAGAGGVYCVDSAGCMTPDQVGEYVRCARERSSVPIGFHGHNNLMLAVANCLAAIDAGARFIDGTLFGLGRSAGNAPTEILVALLERMNRPCGVDLFALMNFAESAFGPILEQMRMHTMLAVAEGYGRFHSSFLPAVIAAARRHRADLRRLVAAMGIHDCSNLDAVELERFAAQLAGTAQPFGRSLAAPPEERNTLIQTSLGAVSRLLEELSVLAAKRGGPRILLHLKPSRQRSEGLLMTSFVHADPEAVIGRVTFGSEEILDAVVRLAAGKVSAFLTDIDPAWIGDLRDSLGRMAETVPLIPIRDARIKGHYLQELLDEAACRHGRSAILIYGWDPLLGELLDGKQIFAKVFLLPGASEDAIRAPRAVRLESLRDWRNLGIVFDVILCAVLPREEDAVRLDHLLSPQGQVLSLVSDVGALSGRYEEGRWKCVNLDNAYAGLFPRISAILRVWADDAGQKDLP
ncbi:MAG TPA: hypothetical protein PLP29_19835 [Candidatus Ozemobacteraceae bacterium]|nr:hypothetical protein [Candidatus Ozemobacteraceae bacterium]